MKLVTQLFRRLNEFGRKHPFAMFGFLILGSLALMSLTAFMSMMMNNLSFYASLPSVEVLAGAMAASAVYVATLSIPLALISTAIVEVGAWIWRRFHGAIPEPTSVSVKPPVVILPKYEATQEKRTQKRSLRKLDSLCEAPTFFTTPSEVKNKRCSSKSLRALRL